MKTVLILIASLFLLSACSSKLVKDDGAYTKAKNGPALVVPPLTKQNISGFYVLPDQTQNPAVDIAPPTD